MKFASVAPNSEDVVVVADGYEQRGGDQLG